MQDQYRQVLVMYGLTAIGTPGVAVTSGEKVIGDDRVTEFGYLEIGIREIMVITGGADTGEDNWKNEKPVKWCL